MSWSEWRLLTSSLSSYWKVSGIVTLRQFELNSGLTSVASVAVPVSRRQEAGGRRQEASVWKVVGCSTVTVWRLRGRSDITFAIAISTSSSSSQVKEVSRSSDPSQYWAVFNFSLRSSLEQEWLLRWFLR